MHPRCVEFTMSSDGRWSKSPAERRATATKGEAMKHRYGYSAAINIAMIASRDRPFSVSPGREHPDGGRGHHAAREPAEDC